MAHSAAEVDERSGYCAATREFRSKRAGVPLPVDPDVDVVTFLATRRHSGVVALVDAATGRRTTFAELWRAVAGAATALSAPPFSLRKGHVALILSPNSVHFPVAALAAMSLGAVVTTANPLNTPAEIAKQVADARPVLAFTTRELFPKLPSADGLRVVLLEPKSAGASDPRIVATIEELSATAPDPARRRDRVTQDDQATLLYSSGTTGPSKGVVATHRNLISMVQIVMTRFRLEDSDKTETFLCTVPMFHVYGLVAFATGLLGCGATVVVLSKFELPEMLRCITAYDVTYLPLVPPILVAMVAHPKPLPLGNLRKVLSGGAPLSRELIEGFRDKYPRVEILQGYGLTESTAIGASTDSAEESRRYGTAGLLSPNTEAKIVDPESGEALPVNRTGELWIRGPYVMKDPEKYENYKQVLMDNDDTVEEDVSLARRRRSASALDRPESHGGREVNEPQPQRASTLLRLRRHPTGFHHRRLHEAQPPDPPHTDAGTGRRCTAAPTSCEHRRGGGEGAELRRARPLKEISAAANHTASTLSSTAPPARDPHYPNYVQAGSEVSPPSRRRSGRRRGGKPANRRRRAGSNGSAHKSPSSTVREGEDDSTF